MAIFEPLGPNRWQPTALAAGPFAGLQGGAVASLLTAEVEALAAMRKWGTAISSSTWFLRPTPMTVLRTGLSVVIEGGRVSVIDNTLWPDGEDQPCATVRVTLSRERAVEMPGFAEPESEAADPTRFPIRTRRAAHGRPWFMDAMEACEGDGIAWSRMNQPIIDGAGPSSKAPLSSVLGPADWTHGIARPFQDVVADPNPNLRRTTGPSRSIEKGPSRFSLGIHSSPMSGEKHSNRHALVFDGFFTLALTHQSPPVLRESIRAIDADS